MVTKAKELTVQVEPIRRETIRVSILFTTPLICNRMAEKARQQLLMPPGRKNNAEKASSLKHNPMEEFRASPYTLPDGEQTYIALLGSMFHKGMMSAAIDLPGAAKAQVGRLVRVEEDRVPIYGIPQVFMAIVRSADMNHTPDVRTRAILPQWACTINVTYQTPLLNQRTVITLLSAAGETSGVGDWRIQKGGRYGAYQLVAEDDPEFLAVVKAGGRKQQIAALNDPTFYDEDSRELYSWWKSEAEARGKLKAVA